MHFILYFHMILCSVYNRNKFSHYFFATIETTDLPQNDFDLFDQKALEDIDYSEEFDKSSRIFHISRGNFCQRSTRTSRGWVQPDHGKRKRNLLGQLLVDDLRSLERCEGRHSMLLLSHPLLQGFPFYPISLLYQFPIPDSISRAIL